jgi:hypothetical protein
MSAIALVDKARQKLEAREGGFAYVSFDAAELLATPMAEPNYVLQPFVPEGLMLFCGRPKIGKTTLARQLAHAANTGGYALGERCTACEVWFLSLEEGERLFRKKLTLMGQPLDEWRGVSLDFRWPQGAEGVAELRRRLMLRATGSRPVLVVIDSLQRFRIPPSARGNAFTEDYNSAKLLADLCKEFPGLAIVVLHHTTKAAHDDPVSAISGTYGLSAAADSYGILLKQGEQFRLHAGGRLWDRDDSDFELKRTGQGWEMAGTWNGVPVVLGEKQELVLQALKTGAKTGRALAQITGQTESAMSHTMSKLANRGLVVRAANGWGLV